ncbi:MAG: DNRLRE domain-containing protein [Planctomycetota bacterium]
MNKPLPFVLLTALACGAHSGHTDAEVIIATQDSYIRNNGGGVTAANSNFGSDDDLWLKPGANGFFRMIYLDFDVSSVTLASVVSAELDLDVIDVTGGTTMTYSVYGITDSWDENTITWNNAPYNNGDATPFGTDLGSATMVFADTPDNLTFSSTELLNFVKSSSGTVSLILHPTDMDGNVNLNFHSTEGPNGNTNAPTLTLTVPEPGSFALLLAGGLLISRRRR